MFCILNLVWMTQSMVVVQEYTLRTGKLEVFPKL